MTYHPMDPIDSPQPTLREVISATDAHYEGIIAGLTAERDDYRKRYEEWVECWKRDTTRLEAEVERLTSARAIGQAAGYFRQFIGGNPGVSGEAISRWLAEYQPTHSAQKPEG